MDILYLKWPFFIVIPVMIGLLGACDKDNKNKPYQGYVEGEYLYLAAPLAGYLNTLAIARGERVNTGTALFTIAPDPELQGLQEAEARVIAAKEKMQNLKEPRRSPEIAAMQAQLKAAAAALQLAETQLKQQETLARKGFIAQAVLDEALAARDKNAAQVESSRQQLATYQIQIGRSSEVRSAEADLAAASAVVAQKRWQVEKKIITAPTLGEIVETYYQPGEWVPAGQPVASLLPDQQRKIRFFVPETQLAALHPGQTVEANCDSCRIPIQAKIDFIAPQAEYTPPVIYSQNVREKLVFRVEAAVPPEQASDLRLGLPVDVRIRAD